MIKTFTKQFTNKTLFKPTRWLLIALMFLLGTSGAWAATHTFAAGDYIYIKNFVPSGWGSTTWILSNSYAYVHMWGGTGGEHDYLFELYSGTAGASGAIYRAKVEDAGTYTHVIFTRNSAKGGPWQNKWNQTGNIEMHATYNCATSFTADGTSKTWSCYDDVTAYSVTGSGATVKLSNSSTWITYLLYKDGTEVSNSSKRGVGSALSWTVSEAGEYTVKGTNGCRTDAMSGSYTYNPCPAPDMPTATVEKHTTKCNGTDRNQGVIKLTNYNSSYTYKLGNGVVSVSNDGKMSGLPEGKYYITAVSSCGAETKTTSTFDVNVTDVTPVATVKVTGDNEICSGETTTLTATVTATLGTVSSYSWSPNDGTKDGNKYTTPALTKTTSYLAQAKLTNDNCEKTVSATAYTITVKTAPEKPAVTLLPEDGNIISGNKATLSVSSPVNGDTYTLYEETKGEIETGTSFEITEAGTYYVKGANDCGESPASESKTITVCTIGSTLNSAEYDAATQKVSLEGAFEVCGKNSYYGFQWKKEGSDWCNENLPNENSAYITIGQLTTEGGTKSSEYTITDQNSAYVFRTYVVPVGGAWIYGNEITVTPCITVATPNVTAEPICAGSEATLTLNIKQNGVTYELDNTEEIFTYGNTHTVTPGATTTYTITATSAISCVANQKETTTVQVQVNELPDAPAIKTEDTVCPNTIFELPDLGEGNWYAQAEGGSPYASNTITNGVAATTNYYAEAVKYGCASATRTKYTVNVYEAPVTPVVSFDPTIVGQNKNSVLTISNETYTPGTTAYELYKGNNKVKDITTQNTNVSESEATTHTYTVKATSKACASLTSTSAPVTLTVQESGAQIAALGDLNIDTQDPVDFVAMYVKKDGIVDMQGATKVTAYTWEYSTDDGDTWTECASTATIGVNNGSDKCNNFRPNKEGKYRCKITYDAGDPNFQYSNYLDVTGDATTARTFKGVTMTLPVISVNTGSGNFPVNDFGGTPSKNASSDKMKAKISVDVKIFNPDGTLYYDRKARMNYRGSSSMNFLKKSYAFVTGKEKTKNEKGDVDTGKANLLGVGNAEDKDWVLYAAAADPSLMRNRLMFDTFRDMTGGWSVNSRYVELVVNGEYKGVYVLMDKITANEKRVNVAWKQDINGNTTQEGFIVKFDKTDIVDRYENTSGDQKTFKSTYSGHDGLDTYDTQIDQRFEIEYPEKGDIEEEDLDNNKGAGDWSVVFNSIKDKFNKFEKELKAGNFTEVQKLIDYESWADWFIITEFAKNIDGYRASNFFVYDGSKANAKIEARPLWDQELSFDNQCPSYFGDYNANISEGLLIKNVDKVYTDNCSAPFWFTGRYTGGRGTYNGSNQTFKGLLEDPCFVAVVKARWAKHSAAALSEATLTTKINGYKGDLGAIGTSGTPMNRELKFWQNNKGRHYIDCGTGAEKSCYNGETGYNSYNTSASITQSATDLTNWIKGSRRTNLGNIIEDMEGTDLSISLTLTPANGETTPWEAVMVQVNNPSGYDYDLNYTTNTLDKVEGVIISENNNKYTYRIPRPSTWGTGDGERDAIEYGIQAILNVADDNLQCGTINEELTKADVTITLKDEEDDNCSIVEP